MQSNTGLRALEQYQRNLASGQSRLALEDSVLSQLTDTLSRAKELAVSQGSDNASEATRLTTAKEVRSLIDFVTDLGNSELGGSYLFGGQYADTAPLQADGSPSPKEPSGSFRVEVGARQYVETNHSAQEIFVDSGVMDSLKDLADKLEANDREGIVTALGSLDSAFSTVQDLTGELGARMNQLDVASSNLDSLDVNLQTFRSGLQDADITEAVTRLVERQNALQAAMLANSKILNLSITDYLR